MTKSARRPGKKQTRRRTSAADVAKIVELANSGMARNEIARQVGCAAATVSKYAREAGVGFDREATKAATEASKADLAERRTQLMDRMMDAAERALAIVEQPTVEMKMITQAGRVVTTTRSVDQSDLRNALTTAGIAFDKSTKLLDRDSGVDTAISTLANLEVAIRAIPVDQLGDE